MGDSDGIAVVELKLPCKPEFVGVVRLTILGVASRMKFTYDEVEDLRLAVSEACTTSVQWAERNGKNDTDIVVKSSIDGDTLTVDILDSAGERQDNNVSQEKDQENEQLGSLLITLLVDEVTVTPQNNGTHVKMVKHAG